MNSANWILKILFTGSYLLNLTIAKSIAERPINLVISYYEIQGQGAGSDNKHHSAACEKSPEGCRLTFEFRRCRGDGRAFFYYILFENLQRSARGRRFVVSLFRFRSENRFKA